MLLHSVTPEGQPCVRHKLYNFEGRSLLLPYDTVICRDMRGVTHINGNFLPTTAMHGLFIAAITTQMIKKNKKMSHLLQPFHP